MANFKLLHDLYRFPGFVPQPLIRGIFGEPMAVVISLKRCRKKLSAASAAKLTSAITTSGVAAFAISPVATSASISPSCCDESLALGVRV
jgi:hypothetical protein